MLMVPGRYHDHALPGSQSDRAVERVLEHRAGPDESTVLFRFLIAEPTPDEFPGSHSVTACQYNRPQVPSSISPLHSVLLFVFTRRSATTRFLYLLAVDHATLVSISMLTERFGCTRLT